MEFYRSSAVGTALTKALNTMLESEEISMDDALKILEEFDTNFVALLRDHLVLKKDLECMEIKGQLSSYNNLDAFWKIDAENVTAVIGGNEVVFARARLLFMK